MKIFLILVLSSTLECRKRKRNKCGQGNPKQQIKPHRYKDVTILGKIKTTKVNDRKQKFRMFTVSKTSDF